MKYFTTAFFAGVAAIVFSVLYSCETKEAQGEVLARQYCASCHLFPEPSLLDKKTWATGVLPEMAFRMGIDRSRKLPVVNGAPMEGIPESPMVTAEEWELIKNYFTSNAPEALTLPPPPAGLPLTQFSVTLLPMRGVLPMVCLVKADTIQHKIYIANHESQLYKLDENMRQESAFRLRSPASSLLFLPDNKLLISSIGIIEPNDETKGSLLLLEPDQNRAMNLIDSLKRPVSFERTDLNGDQLEDYAVCEFGNYAGAFRVYENLSEGKFKPHTLLALPGARRVIVNDIDHDGRNDLLVLFTQGNEQIVLFKNKGNFVFETEVLLRFPAVYGSSYFDLVDFNHDGFPDIVYTNGDNYDFSPIYKPYHGVYLFINDGKQKFTKSWFHTMYGASMAMARDYDGDGDIDIAAISFFPDYDKNPEHGFMYFENTGSDFKIHTTPLARSGRWLVMDAADIDHDGDCDLLLGAYDFNPPANLVAEWKNGNTAVLVLTNNLK